MPISLLSAVAFDLDGLLIDTEPIFAEAIRQFLERRGLAFESEVMHSMMGSPAAQSLPRFREHYRLPDPIEQIGLECRDLFFEVLGDQSGPLMPGVRDLLGELWKRRVPTCIATSSGPEFVRRVWPTWANRAIPVCFDLRRRETRQAVPGCVSFSGRALQN